MSDLIFVPELGLISGKSQNLKTRMWYPQPSINRLRQKTSSKSRKTSRPSPFTQTQQLLPLRNRTKSPKKGENRGNLTALEVSMQPRPTTMSVTQKKKPFKEASLPEHLSLSSALEVGLQARPMTMSGPRKKVFNENDSEVFVNLPTLHQRPFKPPEG
jgi:hypothetical protein